MYHFFRVTEKLYHQKITIIIHLIIIISIVTFIVTFQLLIRIFSSQVNNKLNTIKGKIKILEGTTSKRISFLKI